MPADFSAWDFDDPTAQFGMQLGAGLRTEEGAPLAPALCILMKAGRV